MCGIQDDNMKREHEKEKNTILLEESLPFYALVPCPKKDICCSPMMRPRYAASGVALRGLSAALWLLLTRTTELLGV